MIVCGNCGHENEATDAFCGNCGRFLEWSGQRDAAGSAQPGEATPDAPDTASGSAGPGWSGTGRVVVVDTPESAPQEPVEPEPVEAPPAPAEVQPVDAAPQPAPTTEQPEASGQPQLAPEALTPEASEPEPAEPTAAERAGEAAEPEPTEAAAEPAAEPERIPEAAEPEPAEPEPAEPAAEAEEPEPAPVEAAAEPEPTPAPAEPEPEPAEPPAEAAEPERIPEAAEPEPAPIEAAAEPEPEPAPAAEPEEPPAEAQPEAAALEPAPVESAAEPEPEPPGATATSLEPTPAPPPPPAARRGGPSKAASVTLGAAGARFPSQPAAAPEPAPTTPNADPDSDAGTPLSPAAPSSALWGQPTAKGPSPATSTPSVSPAAPAPLPAPPPPPGWKPAAPSGTRDAAQPPAVGPRPVQPSPRSPGPAPVQPAAVQPSAGNAEPAARTPEAAPAGPAPVSQPAARLPAAETVQRPKPAATVAPRAAQPGDRICPNCGEANDAARKFCRRCGTTLANSQVVAVEAKLPWWRRLFRRQPKQYAAGERTREMASGPGPSAGSRIRRLVQVLVLLAIVITPVLYLLVPSVKDAINSGASSVTAQVQHLINPKLDPIRPTSVTASDQLPGHPVSQMFDKYANTDWRANGQEPTATVTFDHTFDLGALIVHSGAADNFTATRRPSQLLLTFPDGSSTTIDLKDDNAAQTINVDKSGISAFTITVVATNGPADQPVVISEIEVFAKN